VNPECTLSPLAPPGALSRPPRLVWALALRSAVATAFAVAMLATLVPAPVRAQGAIDALLQQARSQLEQINQDSAVTLLRRALDPLAGANPTQRVRAFVLLGWAQLLADQPDSARIAFREALRLDPQLRVDSLAEFHAYLQTTFDAERSQLMLAQNAGAARPQVAVADTARPRPAVTQPPPEPRPQAPAEQPAPRTEPARAGAQAPPVTPAQPQPAAAAPARRAEVHREGSFELSVGAAAFSVDAALTSLLASGTIGRIMDPNPGRIMSGGFGRLGLNLGRHIGLSVGSGYGVGSGAVLLSPFAALTYTVDLNRAFSPYVTAGIGVSQFSGNGIKSASSPGPHGGIGFRATLGQRVALRAEGRAAYENFSDYGSSFYNFSGSVGLSLFLGGRSR